MQIETKNVNSNHSVLNEFKEGIFALRTRRFGTVAEIMIKKLYDLDESNSLAFDKKGKLSNEKIEIKFSTALRKNEKPIKEDNVIEQCLKANYENRMITYDEAKTVPFDSNIQQIKRKEFDILYYGLFYSDKIEIFKMKKEDVSKYHGYSDKQHRGNKGEGQFHLQDKNLLFHREHFFERTLTYEELYALFSEEVLIQE